MYLILSFNARFASPASQFSFSTKELFFIFCDQSFDITDKTSLASGMQLILLHQP